MGRAFGELEESFYESGRVLSSMTCTERTPLRRLLVERSDRHAIGGRFTETVSLAGPIVVPECVELGGYFALLVAEDDFSDYASYEVEAV